MAIIDMHCHILPGVDDGARDVETSLAMLEASRAQGVQYMVATPHFYATRDRVDTFLDRRREAWETLKSRMGADYPGIVLGAEVAFFRGISRAERLEALKIEGTDCLLLEMPFRPWSEDDVDEVSEILEKRGYTIILAHIERYLAMRGNADYIGNLLELPVLAQINAESLLDWRQRGKLIKMVRNGQVHLLGSDCHGIHHRPPNLGEGREILRKKTGTEYLDRIDRRSEELLFNHAG
jgi:protein-tyrosine phosphatase